MKLALVEGKVAVNRILFLSCIFLWLCADSALANVTITAGTGGASVSADKAQNGAAPAFTTLGNIVIQEGAMTDFSMGTSVTLILTAPSGWRFNAGAGSLTSNNRDIPSSSLSLSVSNSTITVRFNVIGTANHDSLTISGIQVQATDGGAIPNSGNIFRDSANPGTAVIAGITSTTNANGSGGSNFATLSQAAGAVRLFVVLPGQSFTDAGTVGGSGISGTPLPQTAGMPFSLVELVAADRQFNIVSTYSGGKTITYSGPGGNPSFTTAVSFTSGRSTTSLTTILTKAEATTLTATEGSNPGVVSSSLTVIPGPVTNLQVLLPGERAAPGTTTGKIGTSSTQTAGTAIANGIVVNAVDANWNVVSSATPDVTITSSDANAAIADDNGGTAGNITLVAGTATLSSLTFNTAGTQTLTASDAAGTLTSNTSANVTLKAGTFAGLQLLAPGEIAAPGTSTGKTGAPTAQKACAAFNVTVNAVDASWNLIVTNDTVAIASSDSNATLPANAPLSNGTRTFSVTLKNAGSATLTSSDVTNSAITANTSSAIPVTFGTGIKLTIQTQPASTATAGVAFAPQPVVRIEDCGGNLIASDNSTVVTAARGTGTGTLQGSVSATAVNGVATFTNLSYNVAESLTINFTASGLTSAASSNILVSAADAVQINSSDANAALPANAALSGGTQTFSVSFRTVGSATLTASDVTSAAITGNTSPPITVKAGAF